MTTIGEDRKLYVKITVKQVKINRIYGTEYIPNYKQVETVETYTDEELAVAEKACGKL